MLLLIPLTLPRYFQSWSKHHNVSCLIWYSSEPSEDKEIHLDEPPLITPVQSINFLRGQYQQAGTDGVLLGHLITCDLPVAANVSAGQLGSSRPVMVSIINEEECGKPSNALKVVDNKVEKM